MHRILIVDDEEAVRYTLKQILSKYGFVPYEASGEAEAIRAVKSLDLDLILLDLIMPGPDGMETLLELKKVDPDMPVIMMTGKGDISTAVQAIKIGAYDFITKPLQTNRLIQAIQGGLERFELRRSVRQLQTSLEWIFGKSTAVKGVIQEIRQIAWGNAAIVIHGERGTGKSVTAQVIHNLSKRAHLPFRSVRIGAISEPLVETELFGRGKEEAEDQDGARKGVIESARGGTVFIDGLKLMLSAVQDKLLKTLEERRVYPGDVSAPVEVDVRMIMGTDTDLRTLMRRKKLTAGLHRHLSGPVITLPPLRERMEDVRFLAAKFLWKASIEMNRQVNELDEDTIDLLMHHSWPGNVRELENTIRRAVLSSEDGVIRPDQVKSIIEGAAEYRAPFSFLPHKTAVPEGTFTLVEGGAKAAPEALQESYREIVRLSPNGIFIYARERIEFANPVFARIIGAGSPEELYGSPFLDLFPHEYRDLMEEAFRRVTADGQKTPPMRQKMVRLDGSVVDVETTAFPFAYDGRDAVMVVVEDITRGKKAEDALKVTVARWDEDKETLQNAILTNIKELILPYLQRVRSGRLTDIQAAYMDMIESSLDHVVSPLLKKMRGAYSRFTPTEIQVADMIRNGKATKEIAELLNVGTGTIEGHRNSIRKKLGLNKKKTNLQSYLSSM
jgi:PAS domain S-box-containing protein